MARLNTRTSATPQIGRSSTVDSLYRDATPQSRGGRSLAGTARESTYSVMSPSLSQTSDKENEQPSSLENTPRQSKGKRPMATPATQAPTPPSGAYTTQPGNKRRRTDDYAVQDTLQVFEDGAAEEEPDDAEEEDEDEDVHTAAQHEADEDAAKRYYDPEQNPDVRRELRANLRKHRRQVEDNRDNLVQPGNNNLHDAVKKANQLLTKVKQTADAAMDSSFMVLASDLAGKKLNNTLHGNNGVGIDVDHFVSRLINFTRSHGDVDADEPAPTQARAPRRKAVEDEEDNDEDEGNNDEALDWAWLGREVCFSINKRPPVSSFLLGPLSVQKRTRVIQRKARSQRQPTGPATRPQELTQADLQKSESSNLSHLVKVVEGRLKAHINEASSQVEEELDELEEVDETDYEAACKRHRVYKDADDEPAVSLFEAVINPESFGQTVENMFYVSFLIREGVLKVSMDDNGLPLLVPTEARTIQEQRQSNATKHQAVFSIDYETWKKLIEAFNIKESIIPHREPQQTNVAAGGWYA